MDLIPATSENLPQLLALRVKPSQEHFVASNPESLEDCLEASRAGTLCQCFGLYHKQCPVGFTLLSYDSRGYTLWRLMLDARYQGQGLGSAAMECILAFLRTKPWGPASRCFLSYEPDNYPAAALYRKFGFYENGDIDAGEIVAEACLEAPVSF